MDAAWEDAIKRGDVQVVLDLLGGGVLMRMPAIATDRRPSCWPHMPVIARSSEH
jgi:hypothetical protein